MSTFKVASKDAIKIFRKRTADVNATTKLLLQHLRWCCVDCVIHHERDMCEEQKYICVARASNNKRECDA